MRIWEFDGDSVSLPGERHPLLVVRQVFGCRLDASRSVEKMHRQFLRADSTPLPSSGRAGLRQGIGYD